MNRHFFGTLVVIFVALSLAVSKSHGCGTRPTARIVSPDDPSYICVGNSVSFDGVGSASAVPPTGSYDYDNDEPYGGGHGITEYEWDFGDGSDPCTAASPSHTYLTASGIHGYRVTLEVTDDDDPSQTSTEEPCTVYVVEVDLVTEDKTSVCVCETITFTAEPNPPSCPLGCIEWQKRYRENSTADWGDWETASGGDNTAVLNTGTPGIYQYRARNGSGDSWKTSSVVTVVKVASLLPNEGTEIDDGDGNPDTKSFVVCVAATGVVTVTATPNPSVSEENLPDCWSLTGGNVQDKLHTEVDKTTAGVTTITCTCNTSSKTTKIYVIGDPIESRDICGEPYGKYLVLANPASASPTDLFRAKPGQPSGTTYKWEISSGATKAHIVGSDTGSTVTLKADQEGDFTLKLTYTKSGTNCISYLATAVQKPSRTYSFVTCGNRNGYCNPGWRGAYRWVYYHIRDGANRPIPHAVWDEWWHCTGSPVPCCWAGADVLDVACDGVVHDHLFIDEPQNCDNWGLLCSDRQTIKVSGWPVSGHFWDNNLYYYDANYTGVAPFISLSPHCTN